MQSRRWGQAGAGRWRPFTEEETTAQSGRAAARATPLLRVDPGLVRPGCTTFLAFAFQDESDDMTVCEAKVSIRGAYKMANGWAQFRRQLLVCRNPGPVCQVDLVFQKEPQSKTHVGLILPAGHQFESLSLGFLILGLHVYKSELNRIPMWVIWRQAGTSMPGVHGCFLISPFIVRIYNPHPASLQRFEKLCRCILSSMDVENEPKVSGAEARKSPTTTQAGLFTSENSCWMFWLLCMTLHVHTRVWVSNGSKTLTKCRWIP